MENDYTKRMRKKQKAYDEAMADASIVTSPANVLGGPRKNLKVLKGYNSLVY